jgi:hypothetical protein
MMQPIIHEQLTHLLMPGRTPAEAAALATKLYTMIQAAGMDIIRGEWEKPDEPPKTWETVTNGAERRAQAWTDKMRPPMTWESLARRADELVERRPWNPPELR